MKMSTCRGAWNRDTSGGNVASEVVGQQSDICDPGIEDERERDQHTCERGLPRLAQAAEGQDDSGTGQKQDPAAMMHG
jgi:hypothetical protein